MESGVERNCVSLRAESKAPEEYFDRQDCLRRPNDKSMKRVEPRRQLLNRYIEHEGDDPLVRDENGVGSERVVSSNMEVKDSIASLSGISRAPSGSFPPSFASLELMSIDDVLQLRLEIEAFLRRDFVQFFPDELILEIFRRLTPSELFRCGHVSRCWRRLANDPLLWRRLSLTIFPFISTSYVVGSPTLGVFLTSDWKRNFCVLRSARPLTELARTYFSALVTTSGDLYVTGGLNHAETVSKSSFPIVCGRATGEAFVAVCVGQLHFAALSAAGRLYTWGCARHGRLGHGDVLDVSEPKQVKALKNYCVVTASVGVAHSAAVTQSGALFVWGCAGRGRLGISSPSSSDESVGAETDIVMVPTPVKRLADEKVVSVTCGGYHTLALTAEGAVYGWGLGRNGRLGIGSDQACYFPAKLYSLGEQMVVSVSAGWEHSLCVTSDGVVYAWGRGTELQLGLGGTDDETVPMPVESLRDSGVKITSVSAGGWFSLGLSVEGNVYTWGRGNAGQLGHNDFLPQLLPKMVDPRSFKFSSVVAISGGPLHAVAVTSQGEAYGWGRGKEGQLGNGTAESIATPRRIRFPDLEVEERRVEIAGGSCIGSEFGIARGHLMHVDVVQK